MRIGHTTFIIIVIVVCNSTFSFGQLDMYEDSLAYYYEKKNDNKILLYFDKILALEPTSTYYLLHKGAFLHGKERYSDAIEEFSKALDVNPNIVDAYVRRGISYLGLQRYDSGIIDFNRAIGKYRHQDSVIFRYRGLAFLMTKKFASAKSDYDSALKFAPHDKELLNNRAWTKVELLDLYGALDDLNSAIGEDPNYLNAIKNRAIVNSQAGNLENALKDSNHYLKYFPADEHINLIVGAIFFNKKEYKKALLYLDKSREKLKTKDAFLLSGLSHYFLVQDHQAIEYLTQALNFNPTQREEAEIFYVIGICKNNIEPKSGCNDIAKATELGLGDAKRTYKEECE